MTLLDYIKQIHNKRVTVIGAGISNRPLIRLLAENGIDVTVCDKAETLHPELAGLKIKTCLGEAYLEHLDADIIFRTPGLHPFTPQLKAARERGAQLTSEMELFLQLCPGRVIAVTGSDGKTTTTTLIAEMLKAAGHRVFVGGNIGQPLLCRSAEISPADFVVLELSSFQLHSMYCAPEAAVITNLAPNHLDVHPDYRDYINAKKQIFLHQDKNSLLVLNADNTDTAACAREARGVLRCFSRRTEVENGVYLSGDETIYISSDGVSRPVMKASEIALPGLHNIENIMAAFAAVLDFADTASMVKVAREFTGVAHRLETIRVLHGVRYINDSIASGPNRTIAGLSCFEDKLILIAGGKDKGLSFDELGDAICQHVKALYLTGLTAGKIKTAVEASKNYKFNSPEIFVIDDFKECVLAAAATAREGDTVLLSPASTSFDKFQNFEQRGNAFRKIVEELQ